MPTNDKVTIDRAGRVVIPKLLRDALGLEPGDTLHLDFSGDQIGLRPVRERVPLVKEQGVWTYRSGNPASSPPVQDLIQQAREERIHDLLR